jgi:hypothetical protein
MTAKNMQTAFNLSLQTRWNVNYLIIADYVLPGRFLFTKNWPPSWNVQSTKLAGFDSGQATRQGCSRRSLKPLMRRHTRRTALLEIPYNRQPTLFFLSKKVLWN